MQFEQEPHHTSFRNTSFRIGLINQQQTAKLVGSLVVANANRPYEMTQTYISTQTAGLPAAIGPGALNYGVKTSFFTAPLIAGLAIAPEAVIPAVGLSIAAGEAASYATTGKTMTLPQLLITADIASITGQAFASEAITPVGASIFASATKGSLEIYALSGFSGMAISDVVSLFGGAGAHTNGNTNTQQSQTQLNPAVVGQSATTSTSASSTNTTQTNYLKSLADAFLKSGAVGIEYH